MPNSDPGAVGISLKLVFQGGGAKLVTLMAAAEAVRQLEERGRVNVCRVAGTSAGSIVACMLASPRPYAEYREAVMRAGASVIGDLRAPGCLNAMRKAYWGSPLLPESKLREFLHEIFGESIPPVERLSDLKYPTTVVATDLRHREKVLYHSDKNGDKKIEDVVADSCALPFVFRSHRSNDYIVDGGICSNLPAEALFGGEDDRDPDALMLAFSFEPERQEPPQGALQYAGALMSTAIDASVATAAERIEAAGGVLCLLPQEYGTFEFERALNEGLTPKTFGATAELVRHRIEKALEVHWEKSQVKESSDSLRRKILETHRSLLNAHPYDAIRASTYIIANSLRDPNDWDSDRPDEVIQKVEYSARNKLLWTLRVGISTSYLAPVAGDADWRIEDDQGNQIGATHLIVPETVTTADGSEHTNFYALFFLHQPVQLENDRRLRVVLRSTQRDIFPGLKQNVPEFMRTFVTTNREVEEHVVAIPASCGVVGLSDLAAGIERIPDEFKPTALERMKSNWKCGRKMTPDELREHAELAPAGCQLYGWRTENASPGQYCGVLIAR